MEARSLSQFARLEQQISAVAVCRSDGDELIVETEEYKKLSEEHRKRIQAIMSASDAYYKGFASSSHRFYLIDHLVETDVRKTSPGGMMGHRYLDIEELAGKDKLQQDASSEDVAGMLNGTTYE